MQVYINIENLLKEKRISKNKLCEACKLQRTQLNNYCKNKVSRVDLTVLAKLCEFLDCTPNGDTMLNQQFFSVPVNKISKSELLGVYEKLLKIINSDLICRIQSPVIGTDGTISGKLLPLYPPEFEEEIFSGIYSDFLREISERNDLFRLMNWEIDSEKETMLSHGEPLDFIP